MTVSAYLIGCLGQGPMSESALIAKLIARDYEYEQAVILVKNALTDLLIAKRIEQIGPGVSAYRLSVGYSQMEDGESEKVETVGGYRNYVAPAKAQSPTDGENAGKTKGKTSKADRVAHDATPLIGSPCMDADGE